VPNRKYRTPQVYEQKVCLLKCIYRQFFIKDLGHDQPTILLTNDRKCTARQLILRYAKRMLIENALADAVRFFHIDALSSSVGFKVDFDMSLLVLASGLYRIMARRMRGYDDAQARQIFRDLIDMPAQVSVTDHEVRGAVLPTRTFADRARIRPIRQTCRGAMVGWVASTPSRIGHRPSRVRLIPVRGN
jgi:hypothetical protein